MIVCCRDRDDAFHEIDRLSKLRTSLLERKIKETLALEQAVNEVKCDQFYIKELDVNSGERFKEKQQHDYSNITSTSQRPFLNYERNDEPQLADTKTFTSWMSSLFVNSFSSSNESSRASRQSSKSGPMNIVSVKTDLMLRST